MMASYPLIGYHGHSDLWQQAYDARQQQLEQSLVDVPSLQSSFDPTSSDAVACDEGRAATEATAQHAKSSTQTHLNFELTDGYTCMHQALAACLSSDADLCSKQPISALSKPPKTKNQLISKHTARIFRSHMEPAPILASDLSPSKLLCSDMQHISLRQTKLFCASPMADAFDDDPLDCLLAEVEVPVRPADSMVREIWSVQPLKSFGDSTTTVCTTHLVCCITHVDDWGVVSCTVLACTQSMSECIECVLVCAMCMTYHNCLYLLPRMIMMMVMMIRMTSCCSLMPVMNCGSLYLHNQLLSLFW